MNRYLKICLISCFFIFLLIIFLVYWTSHSEKTVHEMFYPHYYTNVFPEEEYPPICCPKKYKRRVEQGYKSLKESKVAILGLAYNLGEEKTHKLMKRLSYLTKKCKDYRIIIYAADSEDISYPILKNYAKYNKRILLPSNKIDKTGLNRVQKMSKLRNYLRDYLVETGFNPDYVLCQDCDLSSAISLDGVANSIYYLSQKKYHAMFANGINNEFIFNINIPFLGNYYYDAFAFKEDPEYPMILGNKGITCGRGEEPLAVKSAFGGAAIYNYKVFKKFRYDEKRKHSCEHVVLNSKIYNAGYKLAINPSMLLISGRQGEKFHKTKINEKFGKKGYEEEYRKHDQPYNEEESYNIF